MRDLKKEDRRLRSLLETIVESETLWDAGGPFRIYMVYTSSSTAASYHCWLDG